MKAVGCAEIERRYVDNGLFELIIVVRIPYFFFSIVIHGAQKLPGLPHVVA